MLSGSLSLEVAELTCCLTVWIWRLWSSHAVLQSVFGGCGAYMLSYSMYLELLESTCRLIVGFWR